MNTIFLQKKRVRHRNMYKKYEIKLSFFQRLKIFYDFPGRFIENFVRPCYRFVKNNKKKFHVVAIDYGVKKNILRYFSDFNCRVTVVSCKTLAADIIKLKPNG